MVADQLLQRWGVVFRDLAVHEGLPVPWRDVQWALRRFEDRGLVREGWFADLLVIDPTTIATDDVAMRMDLPGGAGRLYVVMFETSVEQFDALLPSFDAALASVRIVE